MVFKENLNIKEFSKGFMESKGYILKESWMELKKENPKIRIRDAANHLGVSELELLLTVVQDEYPKIYFLGGKPSEIISKVSELGYVMALSRNDVCVHERKGVYGELSLYENTGLIVGEDIDLRIFFQNWKYSLAVQERDRNGALKLSLQFFDKFGTAIHKIHLNEKSNHFAYQKLVQEFQNKITPEEINSYFHIEKLPNKTHTIQPIAVSSDFLLEWGMLKDTHDFFGLLKKFQISRIQAMEIAEGKFTKKIQLSELQTILESISQSQIPIMIFVYNPGIVQIHTGLIENIQILGPWLNVLDLEFNLHINQDLIGSLWKVEKPTVDGPIHSIEVYNKAGDFILQFFGKRKPNQPEREDWYDFVNKL